MNDNEIIKEEAVDPNVPEEPEGTDKRWYRLNEDEAGTEAV